MDEGLSKTPPVKRGEECIVEIYSDGIGKIDGYFLFVPGAKLGQRYSIRITNVTPKFGFASIIEES